MNKIKGSIIAKLIAWVLCIACAVGMVMFGYLMIAGMEEGYFQMSREEALEEAYRHVNAVYSRDAYTDMISHKSQKKLTENGFQYGILQTENIAEVDFSDKTVYMDTNMTQETLKSINRDKLYLYRVEKRDNGTSVSESFGCIGDWENLHFDEESGVDWSSQYADAVCFDLRKGIFYYRSEGYYYPAQNVSLFYQNKNNVIVEYNYDYNFGTGKYELGYHADMYYVDPKYGNLELEAGTGYIFYGGSEKENSTIESILLGGEEGRDVNLGELNNTPFNYLAWGTVVLDNIREIDGKALTLIDSDEIEEERFINVFDSGYFLDENYTLHVAYVPDVEYYWIVSLVPDVHSDVPDGSMYSTSAMAIELFYIYGENVCIAMIFMAIMTLVSFLFLACASGYRKDREGIVLTWFDRLPLEVLSAAVFFVECAPLALGVGVVRESVIRNNVSLFFPLIISAIGFGCIIALWYVLSLCVRIKYGKWWQNTICYKLFDRIRAAAVKLFENIALMWKLFLIILINQALRILFVMGFGSEGVLFYWVIENIVLCVAAFHVALQIDKLQKAAEKMAGGNLGYKVDTKKMFSPCKRHGENLNKIGEGLSKAVDERMKSERFKTELITNVSHDIKTPLTSIINYVDLLEKEELNNEKAEEYLDVLERQSSKLKKLIEDLVEASKASTGNLEVGNELLEAGVFLTQTVGEFEEKLSLSGLELIVKKPEKPIYISADGRHLWRVVDNLMNNICKYAQPSSRVYVNLEKENDSAVITFRNISRYPLNINGDELAERFIRGDSSRNTEGHGLGLSIAQSLMDLMGGVMKITVDGDLFKVRLEFQLQEGSEELLRQHEEERSAGMEQIQDDGKNEK